MTNRWAILLVMLLVLFGAILVYSQHLTKGTGEQTRTGDNTSQPQSVNGAFIVIEPPGLVSAEAVERLNKLARFMLRDLDVEFFTVVKSSLGGKPIEVLANQLVSERKIGARTKGARGLLFLATVAEKQVRFEVGYDLEPVFPDSFVGYIQGEQMKPFFEDGKVGQGIEATLEMIITRAYDEIKKGGYNPLKESGSQEIGYSGGAGAKKNVEIGVREGPLTRRVEGQAREYFSPGKTPEETWEKYLQSLRRGITDPSLDIYSDKDKEYYAKWTVTPAQLRNMLRDYENKPFVTEIQGDLAVLAFPAQDRRTMPIFLRRERGGWVFDFYTSQAKALRFNQRNEWFVQSFKTEYQPLLNRHYRFDTYGYAYDKSGKNEGGGPYLGCNFFWHGYDGKGVVAHTIPPESPAASAGIHEGDFILSMDGIPIEKPWHLTKLIREKKPGDTIKLEIVHGALDQQINYDEDVNIRPNKGQEPFKRETISVKLGTWPR